MTPFPGFNYHMARQPKVGELVATKFGLGTIVKVGRYGRTLEIETAVHGRETVERHAERGWWTIRDEALPTQDEMADALFDEIKAARREGRSLLTAA